MSVKFICLENLNGFHKYVYKVGWEPMNMIVKLICP